MTFKYTILKTHKYDLYNCQMQVLHEMKRQGHAGVAYAWRDAGLTLAEFLPKDAEVKYHALFDARFLRV